VFLLLVKGLKELVPKKYQTYHVILNEVKCLIFTS